ncbi:hypothetical protein DVH24_042283 [Malus domestica]|uniref:BRX domain-containing protein n=1 Tax=Malus domestica TaxID=3750 RepID=A0A498J2K3_MALDO|nr:hypothetical protein DVH24_042283 [Malus domestica]
MTSLAFFSQNRELRKYPLRQYRKIVTLPPGVHDTETIKKAFVPNVYLKNFDGKESGHFQDGENGSRSKIFSSPADDNPIEAKWIEQYELGVYITLVALRDGSRDLKRGELVGQ